MPFWYCIVVTIALSVPNLNSMSTSKKAAEIIFVIVLFAAEAELAEDKRGHRKTEDELLIELDDDDLADDVNRLTTAESRKEKAEDGRQQATKRSRRRRTYLPENNRSNAHKLPGIFCDSIFFNFVSVFYRSKQTVVTQTS
jgi:hypothetical protein